MGGQTWCLGGGRPSLLATAVAIVATLLTTVGAARADGGDVDWLCEPGLAGNPCEIPLDTTLQGGGVVTPERVAAERRPIDCFYVYPTVSNQPGPNATKAPDPEIVSIAKFQAARFSSRCRVYAPLYRQITLAGIGGFGVTGPGSPAATAFADVLAAWRAYLRDENGGRGVILIGHSQGTIMLRQLIRTEIERNAEQRRVLAGALLIGGNVTVDAGEATGGDFERTPLCTKRGQYGCVVAYSTYSSDPGPAAFFGNTDVDFTSFAFGLPHGPGYEVACTDPGALSGERGPVGVTFPSEPFAAGAISASILATYGGPLPTAETTWVSPPDRYAGACRTINGANVYRYDPTPGSRRPNEVPPSWGTHLLDVNLGYDRLVEIAGLQADGWLDAGLRVGDARLNRRRGTARLPVLAPGAGAVTLRGHGVRRTTRRADSPRTLRLKLRPRGPATRRLRRHGRARVRVSVRYEPAIGEAASATASVALKLRR